MNQALRRVALACLVMFLLLLVNANYVQGFEAGKLASGPGNGRTFGLQYQYQRGSIITADNQPIAESKHIPGIYSYQRLYPSGPVYAPVTGYDTPYQKTGIEGAEDRLLAGTDPRLAVRNLIDLVTGKPKKGATVQLTINSAAQQAAYEALKATGLPSGAVAIDPKTGAILALASYPSFNPNNPDMVDKAGETTLDVEWAHAMAPGAGILLVETPAEETATGGGFPQMIAAENYVIEHNLGDVISQSFSLPEQNFPSRAYVLRLRYAYVDARRHHVTVLGASNDNGVTGFNRTGNGFYHHRVVQWPASDPLVTGVGGTTLHLTQSGTRTSPDTAWNDTWNPAVAALSQQTVPFPWASSGGLSRFFSRPAYQDGVPGIRATRGVPDVSADANGHTGMAIVLSAHGRTMIRDSGGTSASAPIWAALIALADQYAGRHLGFVNAVIYQIARSPSYHQAFHDITLGNNTVQFPPKTITGYQAAPGWDPVTGWGSPDAQVLIPLLARYAVP